MSDENVGSRLLVEEYKSCRDLIAKNIDIIERTEVYAIGAAAATATFSLAATNPTIVQLTCWAPLIISILGLLRFIGIDRTIHKINNYLTIVEDSYSELGWTKSYREQNKHKILKLTRFGIWAVAIISSGVFAYYLHSHGPIASSPTDVAAKTVQSHSQLLSSKTKKAASPSH